MNEMKNKEALEAVAMAVADEREFEVWWTDSPEMNEFLSQNEIDDSGNVQSLFFAAAYIVWKASRAALAATPANCDSLEQLNGNNDLPAAAPVVLPEPFTTLVRKNSWSPSCYEASPRSNSQEYGRQWADERINVHTEQQVRALLAGVSAPAAQAVASIYVTADGQRECDDWKVPLPIGRNLLYTAPQTQADARDAQLLAFAVSEIRRDEMTDSELLDAMEQKRIAVVPEYEGPWDAEIYNDEGKPNHRGSGSTPREAIRAAIAAQAAQQGDDKQ